MRDAFGGSFMIKLFIVFIIIYVGFTAVALNYAKAFKVKNAVVSYLEENEISSLDMTAKAEMEMRDYFDKEIVGKLNYVHTENASICQPSVMKYRCYDEYGIMIEQIEPSKTKRNKLGVYYRVTTYFGFDMPFFNRLIAVREGSSNKNISGTWKIVGETRPIAYE